MNPENRPIRSIFTVMSTAIRTLEKEGRLTMEKSYIQHGSTSVYEHSVKVAYTSLYFARRFRLNIDEKSLIRGALLHDYFLYDWHEKDKSHRLHGFYHPSTALRNAKEDFALQFHSFKSSPGVEPRAFTSDLPGHLHSLYTQ